MKLRRVLFLLIVCAAGGCAAWREPDGEVSRLPSPMMSPDSVVLEIIFVQVPPEHDQINGSLWDEVDEQHLPADMRRRLLLNGFRCGLVGMQLPGPLLELLQQQAAEPTGDGPDAVQIDDKLVMHRRRLQIRAGHRGEIQASAIHPELAVLVRDVDNSVRGETYYHAQCLLAVRSWPQGDGRVRLELTPELHHGQPKNRYVGRNGMIRIETGRERKIFGNLRIGATFSPGQSLILTRTAEQKGLGQRFFTNHSQSEPVQELLLIRLAQMQQDDLFAVQ